MFCHKCGTSLPDDAVFCNGCGTRVGLNTPPTSIPSPLGRVTIQFSDDSSLSPTSSANNPSYPPTQLSNVNNPVYPPTQFGSNPSGPVYPPMGMSGGPSSAPVWQTAGLGQPQQAGASVPYAQVYQQVVPANRVQQMLLRVFGSKLAM